MGIPDANLLNEKLFNFFMPDKEYFNDSKVEYEKGKIVFNSVAIYGLQGSGKTTLANAIVGKFIEKYGVNEVNAYVWDKGLKVDDNFEFAFYNPSKLIHIILFDDFTLLKIKDEDLNKFFTIRHIAEEYGKKKGLIFAIFNIHRFYGLQLELRSNIDCIIIREVSLNEYDKNFVKRQVKDNDSFVFLDKLPELRRYDPKYFNYSFVVSRIGKGFIYIEPSKTWNFD